MFSECIESDGSEVQLGCISGTVAENDLGDGSNFELTSITDCQCSRAVAACCD